MHVKNTMSAGYNFIIFLAGLRPRPLGRKERTHWREAKGFLVRGLGWGANPFPIRVHAKRESLLLGWEQVIRFFVNIPQSDLLLLRAYFKAEPTQVQVAKLRLMRGFAYLYYGFVLLYLGSLHQEERLTEREVMALKPFH